MTTETMPIAPGPLPSTVTMPVHEAAPLPQALRDSTLALEDRETLLRIADDKSAAAGRYTRKPRRIPVSE